VKRSDAGTSKAPAEGGNGGATAEDLRRTKSSPLVRKIAEEHGIDIKQLDGTGMSGRVTKNDILSFIESGAPVSPPAAAPPVSASPKAAPSWRSGTQPATLSGCRRSVRRNERDAKEGRAHGAFASHLSARDHGL
jgi:pyruvate/2-oxoglutarate dehydrogenase complex dihydrolipoamide acyltransferase (E2) component